MLYEVDVVQAFTDGLVFKCGWMRLEGPPVLGIGPLLMSVEFVEISSHRPLFEFYSDLACTGQQVALSNQIVVRVLRHNRVEFGTVRFEALGLGDSEGFNHFDDGAGRAFDHYPKVLRGEGRDEDTVTVEHDVGDCAA